jgi:hypothetical protein
MWVLVGAVLVIGAYFRLVGLDDTSLHSDGTIHDVCKSGALASDILFKWEQMLGRTSQMATPAAFTKLFLDVFHLDPTRGNIILPSAFWGILTILAALWVGWRMGGKWFGLLLMAVVAFSPMHVQMSRMAYFYPPSVLGGFIMLWCLVESWESMREGRPLGWTFCFIHAGAIVLLIYSSASSWPLTALLALVHLSCSLVKWKRGVVTLGEAAILSATYVVVGAPLLFFSWGLQALLSVTGDNDTTAYWRKIFESGRSKPMFVVISEEFSKFGWGWTLARSVVTGFVAAVGVVILMVRMRREGRWGLPVVVFFVGVLLAYGAMRTSTLPFGLRRVAPIWPFGFIILAAGLAAPWLIEFPKRWIRALQVVWCGFAMVLLGLWLNADVKVLKANGFPVPYKQIGQWLDRHFPRGTPVVTDRFYTAMCEFNQSDPTTNVVMISTVPNELPEIQEKTRFRDVTRQYFEDNPDGVFYCSGHMYERPEVVPWEWPTRYFRRHQEMRDDCAGDLGLIGQSYYFEYPGTIRWPVIYYNTVEDVVAIKQAEGAAGFILWGPDWRPVQTQDYRLWRMLMSGDAILKVYGLGDKPRELTLALTGVAAGGELRLQIGDQMTVFPANQISQLNVQVKLQPGLNELRLRSRGSANARLLIGRAAIESKDAAGAK